MDYSHADFTGRNLTKHKIEQTEIVGSCFSQENPDTEVFPADLAVTFINCNLDNCVIPKGCTVEGGSNRRCKIMNDRNEWEVDEAGNPIRLFDYLLLDKMGIERPKPEDIPATKSRLPINYADTTRNVRA